MGAVDQEAQRAEWLRYMGEKGIDNAAAARIETEAAAKLAALASQPIRRWDTREEFYALMGVACPPKPRALAGFKSAAKRIEAMRAAELTGAPAPAQRRPRAASAKVETLADARELRELRTEVEDRARANRELARLLDESREALAVANADLAQCHAALQERAPRDDGTPGAAWEARVRDLEAQVAGFLRWGVAS